jgi:hypothetical protein
MWVIEGSIRMLWVMNSINNHPVSQTSIAPLWGTPGLY